jgi:hypothetical protein
LATAAKHASIGQTENIAYADKSDGRRPDRPLDTAP